MLAMTYGVGAKKMVSALGDALKPRLGDAALVEKFEACLLDGLPNGAPKGTRLEFSTSGGRLGVVVNDRKIGAIASKQLCTAFAAIYTDKNAVCAMLDVGEAGSAAPALITPVRGAVAGAALGYGLARLLA